MIQPILILDKYDLNRLDSYWKFKKYEKIQLMSSIFILSIYIEGHMDDNIAVINITGYM